MPIIERKLSELKPVKQTQPRQRIDLDVVADYADALRNGVRLPPIDTFGDIVGDGFHRYLAHQSAERKTIRTVPHPGGLREAILYSCVANATHGLRRSNADKRRAVGKLLKDPEWSQWSDRRIAAQAAVLQTFVSNLRHELSDNGCQIERRVKRGESEYLQRVNLRPERTRKPPSSYATRILRAIALLAKADADKFSPALDEPQRERLLRDLPAAREFLDSL